MMQSLRSNAINNSGWWLLFVFCWQSCLAQDTLTPQFVRQQKLSTDQLVGVDKFNNLYHIKNNVFFKEENGKTYQYKNIGLGQLTGADILNPLKILLFYKNTNTVVFVDNKLNEIRRLDFNQSNNLKTITFAHIAGNPYLWLMNIDRQQLEIYNYKRSKSTAITPPISENIIAHVANYNYCWVLTTQKIMQYNLYGALVQQYLHPGFSRLGLYHNQLIGFNDQRAALLLIGKNNFIPLKISEIEVKDFYFNGENMYLYDGNLLYTYHLKLPEGFE